MKDSYPVIPTLCQCGCNEVIWHRGQKYLHGHNGRFRVSWSKGLNKYNHPSILKMSLTLKKNGIVPPSRKGKPSPRKGKYLTEEHKKIMKEVNIGNKNALGHTPARNFKEKNGNWQGGLSFLPYCEKWTKELREAVRERDGYICQLCGKKQKELTGRFKKLSVHHVHYDKENCYPDLIILCNFDNSNVNFNRKHYEELFMNKLNDRGLLFWTKEKLL